MSKKYTWNDDKNEKKREKKHIDGRSASILHCQRAGNVTLATHHYKCHENIAVKDTKPLDLNLMTGVKTDNSTKNR